ncbi:MAG: 4Fe-4S binding protein [Bdellovibrionales bacterium]|nr:4Fe-4S binding protein [Bdellovibrionales bacterium]
MAYIITEPCIGSKHQICIEVCPVDCIYTLDQEPQSYIDPKRCIDCAICVEVCPVNAIFIEHEVPQAWTHFVEKNAQFFKKKT